MERKYSDLKTFGMLVALFIGKIQAVQTLRKILSVEFLKEAKDLTEDLFYDNSTQPNVQKVCTFFGIEDPTAMAKVLHASAQAAETEGGLREHLNRLHVQIEDKDDEIARLNHLLEASQDCVSELHQTNEELMRENQEIRDKLSDQGDVEAMAESLRAQDTKIAKMEKIIAILMD